MFLISTSINKTREQILKKKFNNILNFKSFYGNCGVIDYNVNFSVKSENENFKFTICLIKSRLYSVQQYYKPFLVYLFYVV